MSEWLPGMTEEVAAERNRRIALSESVTAEGVLGDPPAGMDWIDAGEYDRLAEHVKSLEEALREMLCQFDRRFPKGQNKVLPGVSWFSAAERCRELLADNPLAGREAGGPSS